MNRTARVIHYALLGFLAIATPVLAQQEPHVGYVYPAGGQQGTTLEVTFGGQYLDGASRVYVSDDGVEATVVEHDKPLTQRQANVLRQKLQDAKLSLQPGRGGRFGSRSAPNFDEIANELDVSAKDLQKLMEARKKLNDPKQQPNPQIDERVTVKVALSGDVAHGLHELRLMTDRGLSNPINFYVGDLPERLESEPNDKSPDSVIDTLPAVVNGQILPGDVDRFEFEAQKGQRLVVAASARELIPYLADAVPGWFQATLALLDSDGNEVAYVDDFQFHPDPVLFYEIPEDGAYTLEIKDAVYRGRQDFVYRIALGELPFVTSVFPLGGREGQQTAVELEGWNLPKRTISLDNPSATTTVREVSVRSKRRTSNRFPFAVDSLPECVEQEPNNEDLEANPLESPVIINGRIDRPGDADIFCFEGRKGERVVAEVIARRLNSPLDSVLELTAADGTQIARNDDHEDKRAGLTTHHADSRLCATLPADGKYFVRLGDNQRNGASNCSYRLRISREQPDFELRVVPASINVRAGATVPITIYAVRRDGFDGDIRLSLNDTPRGMALNGGWIPAGQDQVRLTITAPPFGKGQVVPLSLEGSATIGGRQIRRMAVPAEDMMQAFIVQHLVPVKETLVSIDQNSRPGGSIRSLDTRPIELPVGGTALARFAARAGPLSGQMRFELNDPPDGIAIDKIVPGPETTLLVLSADSDKVKAGLKGNLLVDVFFERSPRSRDGKPQAARRFPVGVLPAIAFETVEPKTWLDSALGSQNP